MEVNFLAPVTHMDKLACVGLNYIGHCKEQGVSPPESPVIFSKFPSNIIGPRDNIMLPPISDVSIKIIARKCWLLKFHIAKTLYLNETIT